MTVAEMLGRISSRELSEWIAVYELEAEDSQRDELAVKAQGKLSARSPAGRRVRRR